ncbi:hypothetical protein Tcan_01629 [Toxocara canis]|uniref:Uncharacterized protein n=1 Tax=Toxocara canis TaxID=6265 RepID=A0A0B2VTP8_TOXCA|nr:hypothetical protein Tcan_01629 [Toxocara canis]
MLRCDKYASPKYTHCSLCSMLSIKLPAYSSTRKLHFIRLQLFSSIIYVNAQFCMCHCRSTDRNSSQVPLVNVSEIVSKKRRNALCDRTSKAALGLVGIFARPKEHRMVAGICEEGSLSGESQMRKTSKIWISGRCECTRISNQPQPS